MSQKKLKTKKDSKMAKTERRVLEMVMAEKTLDEIMETLDIDLFTVTKILMKIQKEAEYIKKIM